MIKQKYVLFIILNRNWRLTLRTSFGPSNVNEKLNIQILQGSVATDLRWSGKI